MRKHILLFSYLVAGLVLVWTAVGSATVPSRFAIEGVLRDGSGNLQSAMVNVTASLWDSPAGGNKLVGPWGPTMVMAENGLFTLPIDDGALQANLGAAPQVWLEVTVGNDTFARQRIEPQISALMCGTADKLRGLLPISGGGTGSATQNFVDLTTDQSIAGAKSFTGAVQAGSLQIGASGAITHNWWELGAEDNLGAGIDFHGGSTLIDYAARLYRAGTDSGDLLLENVGAGTLKIVTGSVQRMTILSNGNVGIGTVTPQHPLHVAGETLVDAGSSYFGVRGNTQTLPPSDDGTNAVLAVTNNFSNGGGEVDFFNTAVGLNAGFRFIQKTGASTFRDLLVLNGSGSVGINTLTPDATFSVNGTASKVGGGSWSTFSDERLKDVKGAFRNGLDAILQLEPIRYRYKKDNALGLYAEGEHVGFSAQQVQKVIPEAVTRNERGYLMVNNDPILWTMLNGMKEQQREIRRLQARVDQLQRRGRAQ
jgi:hypothetical protein